MKHNGGKAYMKPIKQIVLGMVIAAMVGGGTSGGQDAFSSINLSGLSDNGVLSLSGTNIATFTSFSDDELSALVTVLYATPTIAASDLPTNRWGNALGGTYWSLQNPGLPPAPGDMIGVDVWPMADGSFLLDDLNYNASPAFGMAASPMLRMGSMSSFAMMGGIYNPNGSPSPLPNYGTNLWIAQWTVPSNTATGIASNTIADVSYEMQWTTNLARPTAVQL